MHAMFAELAREDTPMGVLTLRRRREPTRQVDVYEVKLGDEFLMSSLFTAAEIELARLGLAELAGEDLEVVVGGLGLGYTARAVLDDPRVASLVVVEALGEVISWHEQELLPDVPGLSADPRCRFVHGDFFAMVRAGAGFDPDAPDRHIDAVLVDIDHTPDHHLDPSHADFYTVEGLALLAAALRDDGVFALWSDDPPDEGFLERLRTGFEEVRAEVVRFPNFYTGGESANTVYLGRRPTRRTAQA
jgi:spermidine synthase